MVTKCRGGGESYFKKAPAPKTGKKTLTESAKGLHMMHGRKVGEHRRKVNLTLSRKQTMKPVT